MAIFTSQSDLERRVGAGRVAQLFDDAGVGVPDPVLIEQFANEADAWVVAFCESKGFTRAQLEGVASHEMLRGAATDICLGLRGESKAEWLNDRGEGQYEKKKQNGREMLKMLVTGELRIKEAGPKTNITGRLSAPDPVFTIASSSQNRKGPGGF